MKKSKHLGWFRLYGVRFSLIYLLGIPSQSKNVREHLPTKKRKTLTDKYANTLDTPDKKEKSCPEECESISSFGRSFSCQD